MNVWRSGREVVAAVAILLLAISGPAVGQGVRGVATGPEVVDCDPEVAEALVKAAEAGAQADLAVIRHRDQGIRKPDSILDLSCVWDMFDYRGMDILYNPGDALDRILDLARDRICSEAWNAYGRDVGRGLDAGVFAGPVWDVPGARTRSIYGNALEDAGIERERFRRLFGGAAQ